MECGTEEAAAPPTVESLKEQGNAAVKKGAYEEAILHYTYAIKLDPKNHILHSNRSFAFLKLKQYSLALEDAQRTVVLEPDWAKGYFRCGEVELATGRHDEALVSYEIALKCLPNDQSICECVEKAKRAKMAEELKDVQVPWVGAGVGIVVGVIILIADYEMTDNPTHPLIMVFATMAISLIGFVLAKLLRAYWQSQKRNLIAPTPLPTDAEEDDSQDNEEDKNGRTRNRYTKSQARQRFRKGKM